jgi:hypothetical protein
MASSTSSPINLLVLMFLILLYGITCRHSISSNRLLQKQIAYSDQLIKEADHYQKKVLQQPLIGQTEFPWIIVTGSDESHFPSVLALIATIHLYEPWTPVIFYDLGLTARSREILKSLCHVEYRRFPFEHYPIHMDLRRGDDKGGYAWKVVLFHEVLLEYETVIWLDAGDRCVSPLYSKRDILQSQGFLSVQTLGPLGRWSVPQTYRWFNVSKEVYAKLPICNGAMFGMRRSSKAYSKVMLPWLECAFNVQCIMPLGADYSNYRHDQTILSFLANMNNFTCDETYSAHDIRYHHDDYYLQEIPYLQWKPHCRPIFYPNKVDHEKRQDIG